MNIVRPFRRRLRYCGGPIRAAVCAGLTAAACVAMLGCASYQRPLADHTGWTPGCEQTGFGDIEARTAAEGHAICVRALQTAGFIDAAAVGTTGLESRLWLERGVVRVGAVAPESAAAIAGIADGDVLLAVGQQPVRDPVLARRLLFGRAGSPVAVSVRRGADQPRELVVVRAPVVVLPDSGLAKASP